MKRMLVLSGLGCLAMAAALPAWAETLRCGSSLIQEGATQGFVEEKCGAPDSKDTYSEPVRVRRENGTSFENGTVTQDVWRYRRGQRSFPAVLTFEGGVLRRISFEK